MMMRWSLTDYYASFEAEEFSSDLAAMESMIARIENMELPVNSSQSIATRAEITEQTIKTQTELSKIVSRLMSFCSLTLSVETDNHLALSYQQKIQHSLSRITAPSVRFQSWLIEPDDLEELLEHSPYLSSIEFSLREMKKMHRFLLSEKEENIIKRLSLTGSNAWSRMKGYIESQHMVELELDDGTKEFPLPVIRNFAYDASTRTRKAAYEAELESYESIAFPANSALNAIKGEVLQIVELKGYDSVLDMTLINARMKKKTLDIMLSTIREYLPQFQSYLKHKAKLLGHSGNLPFYDLFAPLGKIDKKYTFDEAREFIVRNFAKFSQKLADFADQAFAGNWIDAEPRKGKRGGAFCSTCHAIGQSRILTNFSGSLGSLTTLAHELGHAYHGYCLKNELPQNTHYSMPVAETASIFAETIIKDAITKTATGAARLAILETKLMEATQVIVDIYSRFLFETWFIEERKNGDVRLEQTKYLMLKAQKEAYGDGLDHDFLHPYMWLCKPHYYYAGSNFYNFPYAFGHLFAAGLYAIYLNDGNSFVNKYDQILRETGRNTITGVAGFAGIEINHKDFWQKSLNLIAQEIAEFQKF
jgi:pepF/M3 family oligoendopeptidase